MTDDIHLRLKKTLDNPHYIIPHEHILTLLIHELTIVFGKSGGNIRDYNLPLPTFSPQVPLGNRLLDEELSLDPLMMSMHANSLIAQLNDDQKIIFDVIVNRVASDEPGFFLLVAMVVLVKRFYGMRLFQKYDLKTKSFLLWLLLVLLLCSCRKAELLIQDLKYLLISMKIAYAM